MKKLVTSGFLGKVLRQAGLISVTALSVYYSGHAQQGCVMTCPPMSPPVEVSLSSACQDVVTYTMLGVGAFGCTGEIVVDIMENGISLGNTITADMIGNTYMVVVSNPTSGQSCMMNMTVVDKQAPLLQCPGNVTLDCNADLASYNAMAPEDISDCSDTELFIDDELQFSMQCTSAILSQYLRTYTVIDEYSNAATCQQLISLAKVDLEDVVFPADLTGGSSLSCAPAPDTTPEETGYPTVNGEDILNGTFCNLSAVASDITVELCSGSYKILRTWTVIDWCAGNQSISAMQTIEVLDKTDPVVIAPDDITVSSGPSSCLANALVGPAQIIEDCSDSWTVRMQGSFGTIFSNGGIIPNLPVGTHEIIYIATNDCDSVGTDTMLLTVQDLQPPVPVCHQATAIPVNLQGYSVIPASTFDEASYDNCGNVYFKVKRMSLPQGYTCANPGNPQNMFDDDIQFCCEDIANNNIMVILRVYDVPPVAGPVSDAYLAGHFNDCMVEVQVQDKLPPQIICPTDLTISCEFPYTPENLEVFGKIALSEADRDQICLDDPGLPGDPGLQCIGLDGLATDNCNLDVTELEPQINVNNCGAGTIIRTFEATDDGGLQVTCQQVITITNFNLFDVTDITWPADYTAFDACELDQLDPEDLDPPYNEPVLNEGPCDLVGATYDDEVFDFSNGDQACFKILRTWKVVDWCQVNTPTYGQWSHIQVIKVMNSTAPVIQPLDDIVECSFDPDCGGLELEFIAEAEDDCSGPASLTWRYFIDEGNNNSFEFISPLIQGLSIEFSRELPIGEHRILYTVTDKCGNTSTDEQFITVESCKTPTAVCIHGLSTDLMPMDTDGDGEADWGMVTLQAEMFDASSFHPCGNEVSVAFSSDPTDVSRVFDCSNLGTNEIELWVIDENGLTDFCITYVEIQDNTDICPSQGVTSGVIAGNISVPQSGALSGAMVHLDGSSLPGIMSSADGHFVFPSMPFGGDYVVRPVREGDDRNGISTLDLVKIQKHLLGLETFTTPYQYIAADINNSASITAIDIIQLRKLILGSYTELPSNRSWRFVDKAHIFPDPHNPWLSEWPETYSIIPFAGNMTDVDFHAVKIGDLNLSANLQAGSAKILPRGDQKCTVTYTMESQPDPDMFRVDLYLEDAQAYEAIQFSFNWDQAGYKLVEWVPGQQLTQDEFRFPEKLKDNASLAMAQATGWQEDRLHLVTMWVQRTKSGAMPFHLFLNPAPTQPAAYKTNQEEPFQIQLMAEELPETSIYNRPNPFKDFTTIYMKSQLEEDAVLRVYALDGQLILQKKLMLAKGENEWIVNKTELRGEGLYHYEIESRNQYSTNRMIIVN